MRTITEENFIDVIDKLQWDGVSVEPEIISKGFLEIEVGDFEWDIPYYGVDKEIALHLKNKLSLLARDFRYPINKDKTLVLSVDKDIVGDLKVIIDKFIDTNKDMDNIVIVFEK